MHIKELHKLRLENFILKHVTKYMEQDCSPFSRRALKEARKTHHQLIKKNINAKSREDQKLPEGSNVNVNDGDFYTVTGLLRKFGYFAGGLPKLCELLPNGTSLETRGHKILKSWIRSVSVLLSAQYKKKYNELPPIGYGHTGKDVAIGSRNNLYREEEEYKTIIDNFMLEHPEAMWHNISNGCELPESNMLKKSRPKDTQKHKERVANYLEEKGFLPRRIRKKIINKDEQNEALKEFDDILKKCSDELPKNKDMKILFEDFKSKYDL